MVTSMVRELLEQGKVGESADAVWANLARERDRIQSFEQTPLVVAEEQEEQTTDSNVPLDDSSAFAFDAAEEEEVSAVEETERLPEEAKPFLVPTPPVPVSAPEPAPISQTNVLAFNAMRPKVSRRKPVVEDEEQMLLFG